MKIVDDRIRTLADNYLQIRSPTPYNCASDCSYRTTATLCNLCEEHVNVINTVLDPDPNPRVGTQLPNPRVGDQLPDPDPNPRVGTQLPNPRVGDQLPNPNKWN